MIVQWYERQHDENTNVRLPDIGGFTLTINSRSEISVDPFENQGRVVRTVLLQILKYTEQPLSTIS
jgi:hypothetical protein